MENCVHDFEDKDTTLYVHGGYLTEETRVHIVRCHICGMQDEFEESFDDGEEKDSE